jgi:CRISPR/Cas system-associated protein Cas10 (large subunit of type III CRISPR-Cas system)
MTHLQNIATIDEVFNSLDHISQEIWQLKSQLLQLKNNSEMSAADEYRNRFGEELHPDIADLIGELPPTSLEYDKIELINTITEKYNYENPC